MAKAIKSYMIKKGAEVLFLDYDAKRPEGEQCQVINTSVTPKIVGFEKSFLVTKTKCSCGECDEEFYIFRHMSGHMVQVDTADVIETHLSIDAWRKQNSHLKKDFATKHYNERKQEFRSYVN